MSTVIEFDPDTHTYTVDGTVYPGVTTILKDVGLIDTAHYTEEAATRGTAVHEAVSMVVKGLLSAEAWGGTEVEPYILAWEKFLRDSKLEVEESERLAYESVYHYATHIDIEAKLQGKPVVIDIKSGALQAWHGCQLAADTMLNDRLDRFVLQLNGDGTYRLHDEYRGEKFRSRLWDKVWIGALSVYWWKRQMG